MARYSSLSLKDVVCLCAGSDDPTAWRELDSRLRKPIRLSVIHTAYLYREKSGSLVEDLVQDTFLKLVADGCHHLRDFAIQHPEATLGYVKIIAANATHDYFKKAVSLKGGGHVRHEPIEDVDPEQQGCVAKVNLQVLVNEIDRCLHRVLIGPDQERDRLIFWLYYRQGMTAKEIAALPTIRLGAKGVESVLKRLIDAIRELILGDCSSLTEGDT